MNLARFFQRLALYRASRSVPLWVLVALALGFWLLGNIGQAQAQAPDCRPAGSNCTLEQAGAHCASNRAAVLAYWQDAQPLIGWHVSEPEYRARPNCDQPDGSNVRYWLHDNGAHSAGGSNYAETFFYTSGTCDAPNTWNAQTGTCVTNETCQALNDEPGRSNMAGVMEVRAFSNRCAANGCNFGVKPGGGSVSTGVGGDLVVHAEFVWTGTCAVPPNAPEPPPPEPPQQECKNAGSMGDGTPINMCVQKDGRVCITAPKSGKQLCWTPGETGEKTTENILQKREGGDKTQNPTPPTKPDLTQEGPAVKTTSTKQPEGTTIITTTTNWKTNDNTDAGTVDQGVPDQGATDGADEGADKGSVTDDGECASPPQVAGGDPLLANIILQTWGAKCAGRDVDAVVSTGDVGDCSQPFTVARKDGGDPTENANVVKLKALRAQLCGTIPSEDVSDGTEGAEPGDGAIWQTKTGETLLSALDPSGWLGGSACPALPEMNFGSFGSITPNIPYWCQLLAWLGAFILLSASIVALNIITG